MHTDRESLEDFYLRLTGQAALCGWTIDQEKEVVRDIFIAKMRYKDIQRELCIRPGATPEETLKSGLLQEKGAQTATDLQKQFGSSSTMVVFPIQNPVRVRIHVSNRNRHFPFKGRNCRIESTELKIINRKLMLLRRKQNHVLSVETGFQQIINKAVRPGM